MKKDAWEAVFKEDLTDDSFREQWLLEGCADLTLESGAADGPFLRITTLECPDNAANRQSVLWCRQRFEGDLRFRFKARGDAANRAIFYFNARPSTGSGLSSIFDWSRPDAQMVRYAGDAQIEMYTIGILRDDQDVCNLRYIGGSTAEAFNTLRGQSEDAYGKVTILAPYSSPFRDRPDEWFDFDVTVVGRRITMEVEGERVLDLEDPGTARHPEYSWGPLKGGGWFGMRNFVPNSVCVKDVEVLALRA